MSAPEWSEREMKTLLTPQQRKILLLVAGGFTNAAIASQLGLSEARVKDELKAIFRKLRVSVREQAVAVAIRFGVIDLKDLK